MSGVSTEVSVGFRQSSFKNEGCAVKRKPFSVEQFVAVLNRSSLVRKAVVDRINKRDGGKATIVRLPEIEIHGDSHVLMQDSLQRRIVSMMLGQMMLSDSHGSASRTGWRA